ncbi:uncharacterized protein LOC125194325 isoform X2 [Salvia hispanica]|uniref:uncharacterized protein LOC125194325 isoform X2 n=1 Tax=Salvia hispanica TaxID=49212 RepID=UPI002009598C|nr:uncharacterized protein LOC125194325 isoform X2 [Salvia hispanica]
MADLSCSFLPLFLPPKRYFSCALHSHNSRISRIKRHPPHLPLLFKPSPFAASASDTDVIISTHKHSDGSFLFRFGDPSEVVKNVETEEAKTVKEEIEGDDTNGSSMVEVMESGDESKVAVSGSTEVSDCADSVVSSSNTLIAVEGESEIPIETELPVLTSNQEIGGICTPALDVEQIGVNEEYKDLSLVEASIPDESFQIENTTVEVSGEESLKETSNCDVEECLKEEDVDSPADAAILNQSSEVLDDITTLGLLEKESDDISSADIDEDKTGMVEEGLDGDYEDSPVDASIIGKSSELGSEISAVDLLEKEIVGSTTTSDVETQPTGNVEEGINEVYEDSPVDIAYTPDNTTAALSENQTADVISAPDIDIKYTGNGEQGRDDKPSSVEKESGVENCITAPELLGKETVDITSAPDVDLLEYTDYEEQGLDEVIDKPSSVEKWPEEESSITAQEFLEKGTADVTSAPDVDLEYAGNVEQGLDEVIDEPSSLEKRPEVESSITAQEYLEKETADVTSAPDVDLEYAGNVEQGLDEVIHEPSSPEKRLEVESSIIAQELLEKETTGVTSAPDVDPESTRNLEQGLDEVLDEPSSMEKMPEVDNSITAQEILEKETADLTSAPDVDLEYTGNLGQGLDEVLDEPSSVEKMPQVDDSITAQELLEKETAGVTSAPDVNLEYTGNVGQGLDDVLDEPSSVEKRPEVENRLSAQDLLENETAEITFVPDIDIEYTGKVDQGLDEVIEEPRSAEKRSEVENHISAQQYLETETSNATSVPDTDIEYTADLEQGLDEVLEESSSAERRPEVENHITAQEPLEKETADATTLAETDPVVSMLETDDFQGGMETAVTPYVVPISELENVETGIHSETIGDERESCDDTLVSPPSQSEPAMNLYKVTEAPNAQAEVQNSAAEESIEAHLNDIMAIEMQNVLNNGNESGMHGAENESSNTGPAMTWSVGSDETVSASGNGMPNETVGYVSEKEAVQLLTVSVQLEAADPMLEEETGTETQEELEENEEFKNQTTGADLAEASVHEVTAPESTESTITSQEILVTDFVLSSGAAVLPHPSKVERMHILLLTRHGLV